MTDPPVSVVIVNHTRREELSLTLKALEYQRYRSFEVIVVSDMAPDARPTSPLAPRWHRFTEANISAARNIGLADAAGELIAFCDDDAQPDFNWLEDLVPTFADPRVGAAGGWVRGRNGVSFQWRTVRFDASGSDIGTGGGPEAGVFPPDPDSVVKTVGTNAIFRRAALREVGGFDEGFRFYLDEADLNLRLSRAGWSTAIVPRAQVYHGFAAGPHRSSLRVPRDLFEIGASQAFFAARHLDGPPPQARQRREQARRLDRLFRLGLVSADRLRWLMARYDAGRAEGAGRASRIPQIGPAQPGAARPATPPNHRARTDRGAAGRAGPRAGRGGGGGARRAGGDADRPGPALAPPAGAVSPGRLFRAPLRLAGPRRAHQRFSAPRFPAPGCCRMCTDRAAAPQLESGLTKNRDMCGSGRNFVMVR